MLPNADQHIGNKIKWAYSCLIVIIIWFSLVLQFSISMALYLKQGRTVAGGLIELFSYFTILTNLLAVVCLTVLLIASKSALGRFFARPGVLTSIAAYITIVFLIYNIILRSIWHPEGFFRLANELLHVINPLLFIGYWIAFALKGELKYRDIWPWLWYPLIYFIYAIVRGALSGYYPYPFLDVSKSGYPQVLLNAVILFPVIWAMCALFVFLGKRLNKRRNNTQVVV